MKIKIHYNIYIIIGVALVMAACSTSIPKDAKLLNESVSTYPDMADIVIPYNIAPMNFHINVDKADDYVTVLEDNSGAQMVVGGQDAQFDVDEWHEILEKNKGNDLTFTVYVKLNGVWNQYKPFSLMVAADPIDEYISYRYIEPSYVTYGPIDICQRHLTDFDETLIYSNQLSNGSDITNEYQCINCHSYQNYHTDNFQFHVRQYKGGTLIYHDGKMERYNLKTDSTIGAGVYPSWHPTQPIIAYSLNHTVQCFVLKDPDHKIEVLDTLSDVALYHLDTNEIQIVQNGRDSYETSPAWSPNGDMLYYSSAYFPIEGNYRHFETGSRYNEVWYDIIRQSYDVKTRKLGEPDTIFKASELHKSASFPRISPDGKYLLYGLADYGYFHVWHKSSDLHVMDLATREEHSLSAMNSDNVECYHAWSSNGRWILFSTRREDGSYTRLYIGYFDKNGKDYKPFPVPQHDPLYNKKLMKSFNVGEFMVEPVKISAREIADVVDRDPIFAKLYEEKP